MSDPHHTSHVTNDPEPTPIGWWDRAAIFALGGAGCALSYDALQQMAVAIHVRPQLSYLFPLVIDGFIAYGIRALLVMSTAPLRARLYTWTLFATATTASIWANALHAVRLNQQTHSSGLRLGDHVVAVLSTIAPLALAGAVHLYILITRHHHTADTKPGPERTTRRLTVHTAPGTTRAAPHHSPHVRSADHLRGLQTRRTNGSGRDRGCGPSAPPGGPDPKRGPADHTAAPDQPDSRADTDRELQDHSGPPAGRRADHDAVPARHQHKPADRNSTPNVSADRATQPNSAATTAIRQLPAGQGPRHPSSQETEDHTHARGPQPTVLQHSDNGPQERTTDQHHGAGPADTVRPTGADQTPGGAGGPDRPTNQIPVRTGGPGAAADQPPSRTNDAGGPSEGDTASTSPTGLAEDHAQEPETSATTESARSADRPVPRTTSGPRPAPESGEAPGMEELLAVARKAALTEGRMTRRALRPHLNQAGMPISNQRFTELQHLLYADPKLAHLPRPGKRNR